MEKVPSAPLGAGQLCRRCDPHEVRTGPEERGRDLGIVGQDRGLRALRLAAEMRHGDFNVFVLGPPGTGRHTAIARVLGEKAAEGKAPPDWAYVNNFADPRRPVALRLRTGMAQRLRAEMERVVDDLASDLPALFCSRAYRERRRALDEAFTGRDAEGAARPGEAARASGSAVTGEPGGRPDDGGPIGRETRGEPPKDTRSAANIGDGGFPPAGHAGPEDIPPPGREHRARIRDLNAETAGPLISDRLDEAASVLRDAGDIADYLARVRADMIDNMDIFLRFAARKADGRFPEASGRPHRDPAFRRYMVNVLVTEDGRDTAAPIVTEDLPTLERLVGRVEHTSRDGMPLTDFMCIRPGALHRANGGYLVVDADRILEDPLAWDALKRSIRRRSITVASPDQEVSLLSTMSLEPDPIALDVRVVLVGDEALYEGLMVMDPEFPDLFKVRADFEGSIDRNAGTLSRFAAFLHGYSREEGLLDLAEDGVLRILDEAVRMAGDTRKLTLRLGRLVDILREAEHYARSAGLEHVGEKDVERAISEREHRASRSRDRIREDIERGIVLVDTEGMRTGQINALSVHELGDFCFGRPSRITASARMGPGELLDIEREAELGGALHSKGVMVLAGYLRATYALDVPFSLQASLVFEQSYGGIDGDSASCAELIALISALGQVPLRQDLAITGSVNQLGEVQAVDAVNEKIEGFFDICAARGLTGSQGVVIPAANVDHLMLRARVVDAVAAGRFQVIPVSTVDEAIAIFTGMPAGARDADGFFPEDSVNARVEWQLRAFAEARKAFAGPAPEFGPGEPA